MLLLILNVDVIVVDEIKWFLNYLLTYIFVPIAIEIASTWVKQAAELVEEIGRRCTLETDDPRETIYPYQGIAIAIQRGNAPSFTHTHTFDIDTEKHITSPQSLQFSRYLIIS